VQSDAGLIPAHNAEDQNGNRAFGFEAGSKALGFLSARKLGLTAPGGQPSEIDAPKSSRRPARRLAISH